MRTIWGVLAVIIIGALLGYAFIVFLPQLGSREGTQDKSLEEQVPAEQQAPGEKTEPTMNPNLKIEDIQEGTGQEEVKSGDRILIHYRGMLEDGTQFDSSYDRGQPFETQIGVGQLIQGWDQGIPGMKIGGKRRLTIPPELGYGSADMGTIPPNSTLIFEVELVDIK